MKFDVLHNFISPVTGRVLADPEYVLVGDRQGIATPSPALIDLRLEIIDLKHDFDVLTEASFVIGFPNAQLSNAQVLNTLADGFMFNTVGIVSTLPLPFAPSNATYILQTPNVSLVSAQALVNLGTPYSSNILKVIANGVVALAIPDVDYATLTTLEDLANAAANSASDANSSAIAAAISAISAANSAGSAASSAASALASATAAAGSATDASVSAAAALASAAVATGAAGNAATSAGEASSFATDASNSADDAANSLAALEASQSYGSINMTGNVTPTFLAAATYDKIAGTTTIISLDSFISSTNNQLQYTGTPTIDTFATASVSISHNVMLGTTISISIFKNGVQVLAPVSSYQLMPNVDISLTVSVYVQFATNDYIEVYAQTTAASTIVADNMNLLVTTV